MRNHTKAFLIFILFLLGCSSLYAQEIIPAKKKKGVLYISWGYNKDWYSRSSIHLEDHVTDNYDFIVHDATAADKPLLNKIFARDLSIPQYCYRVGYYFNDKHNLGIEMSFDHAKYIMNHNQKAHVTGYIREEQLDKDTVIGEHFLMFEHTNGANFLMLSVVKRKEFCRNKTGRQNLEAVLKAGAGVVIPKTDVTLFSERRDNVFHVAGYIAGIEADIRYHFCKKFFLEPAIKGSYANYTNVLTVGSAHANHHFFVAEMILTGGVEFPL
jgi:hypothetical protein